MTVLSFAPTRVIAIALLACSGLLPGTALAQVQASLVAVEKTVQGGQPLHVALRLEHEPHWHTYWLNAGVGYPTRIEWALPTGWSAGDIEWPVPTLIRDSHGRVTGQGFDGLTYLPVTLQVPMDVTAGSTVALKGMVHWLMCADICVPGGADLVLSMRVSSGPPQVDEPTRAAIARMPMPRDPDGWQIVVSRAEKSLTLRATGPGTLDSPHFFPADELVQYDEPQQLRREAGSILLTLPLAEDVDPVSERLVGVLTYKDREGIYRGVAIDTVILPSGTGGPAAADGAGQAEIGASGLVANSNALPTANSDVSLATIALAFVGGLILNLMPCVFPVLGIKILGFVIQAGGDRRSVVMHGLTFAAGVLLSFWLLAGMLEMLRAGGLQLGWGFQLQSAPFVFALGALLLIFALNLSGVFEFGLRATSVGGSLLSTQGWHGSFFAGVLATVVATPCSAPFLAPALGAAFTLPTGQSFVLFTSIALGLSTPYLLLSSFPRVLSVLPKPGRWMETFRQAMAFPLYATVGYLIWVLAGQTSDNDLLGALLGLVVIAVAMWFYGRYSAPGASIRRARIASVGGLLLLVLGVSLGWPRKPTASDVVWEPWSTERVAQLRQEARPIYVDFTARWCATCQANKKLVFSSTQVKDLFRERHVAALKADWTNSDPRITEELLKWNRSAVPFNLVYRPGVPEPVVLPEILTPSVVLRSLR